MVIEAAARSGALNTAGHCGLIGRALMAVPGPVTSAMSVGCHALLRQENGAARLVTSVADVLEVIGRVGESDPGHPADPGSGPSDAAGGVGTGLGARPHDVLDPIAATVLDGLPARGWVSEDELAGLCGVAPPEVLRAIPVLRLAGLVESGPAGHRLARAAARPNRPPGQARQRGASQE